MASSERVTVEYPEHEKLMAVQDESQAIGEWKRHRGRHGMRDDQWSDARERIMRSAVFLTEGVNAAECTARVAADEGALLAQAVHDFIDDPAAYGTDALAAARGRFMGFHSGNFAAVTEKVSGP